MAVSTLDKPQKTVGQVQKEAAMAQKVLNDEVFVEFLQEMQDDAASGALFGEQLEERERARIKVLMIAELRGRLQVAAAMPEEIRENDARARAYE